MCAPPQHLVGRPRKRSHPDGDVPERLNHRLHIVEQRSQRNCVVCRAAGRKSRPVGSIRKNDSMHDDVIASLFCVLRVARGPGKG